MPLVTQILFRSISFRRPPPDALILLYSRRLSPLLQPVLPKLLLSPFVPAAHMGQRIRRCWRNATGERLSTELRPATTKEVLGFRRASRSPLCSASASTWLGSDPNSGCGGLAVLPHPDGGHDGCSPSSREPASAPPAGARRRSPAPRSPPAGGRRRSALCSCCLDRMSCAVLLVLVYFDSCSQGVFVLISSAKIRCTTDSQIRSPLLLGS